MKSVVVRFRIPETLINDNGPQYISVEFSKFSVSYKFGHKTRSPYFAQSNPIKWKHTVRRVKKLLTDANDPHLAPLYYRSQPLLWCNLAPCELLMGMVRTCLPQVDKHLDPKWSYLEDFRKEERAFKEKQKRDFDHIYRVRPLPPLPGNVDVWVMNSSPRWGQVITSVETPQS